MTVTFKFRDNEVSNCMTYGNEWAAFLICFLCLCNLK